MSGSSPGAAGRDASPAVLARLIDAIEAAPRFAFGEDLRKASIALERHLMTGDEAARHIRTLVDGARATPGFPFGADLDAAEESLR